MILLGIASSYLLYLSWLHNTGFAIGSIFWDDEDKNNANGRGGTLPEGNYDGNTRILYCCR